MDNALVVPVLCVPEERCGGTQKEKPGLDDRSWGNTWPYPGSPGILEIQRDPIFGPSEVNVGDTSGPAVEGG